MKILARVEVRTGCHTEIVDIEITESDLQKLAEQKVECFSYGEKFSTVSIDIDL